MTMEQRTAEDEAVTLTEYVDLKRRRRELTWEQVAEVVGVSDETIARWRKANWQPIRLEQLVILATALDMNPHRFFREGES